MTTVVVDASVAIKWLIQEDGTAAASRLVEEATEGRILLTAPTLQRVEVANVLWKKVARGELEPSSVRRIFREYQDMQIYLEPLEATYAVALEIALRHRHPVYDCLYIALAQELGCEMVTADASLVRKLGNAFPFLRKIDGAS